MGAKHALILFTHSKLMIKLKPTNSYLSASNKKSMLSYLKFSSYFSLKLSLKFNKQYNQPTT